MYMSEHKCIYCGVSEDLSESDIIPYALTNARLLNKNVCRINHNNKFSDLFESKVISELAFITNILDIKSRGSQGYAAYKAEVSIDGIEYDVTMRSDVNLFDGRVIESKDKKHKLSSYEKALQIAKDESVVQMVDVNNIEIDTKVRICTGILFDEAMYRMVSKIAFEWYCAKNNVTDCQPEFTNIIAYITEGKGTCPVTIIQKGELYECVSKQVNLGSHVLFGFKGNDNKINVIVSLFGLIMYRIVLTDGSDNFFDNNFLYTELCTDSSRNEIVQYTYESAEEYFYGFLKPKDSDVNVKVGEFTVVIPQSTPKNLTLYPFVLNMIKLFDNIRDDTTEPNEKLNKIIFIQLEQLMQASLLHKKSIKRFVNEHFKNEHNNIKLNPNARNKKSFLMFYILYMIGKSEVDNIDDKILQNIIRKSLNVQDDVITINDSLEDEIKKEMLGNENYSELLDIGANIIKKWNN